MFLVDEGKDDQNTTISGLSFKWRFGCMPMTANIEC